MPSEQPAHDLPFTEEEWSVVSELVCARANAVLADDDSVAASLYLELRDAISRLRAIHGDHPALLETLADSTDEPTEQFRLYAQAAARARATGFPAYTILLSWAEALADEGRLDAVLPLLEESADEMAAWGDEDERKIHRELRDRCREEP